ncbi:MAG: enoyl-CoA hydratase/isomerase family protein [Burkholderiaceae bacterium]
MNFENIRYEEQDGIVEITIDRPAKRNAMTAQMFRDLRECWLRFDASEARVAILRSCDDAVFCAGADLAEPPEQFWQAVPEFGVTTDKPIIAALSGKVIGAGLTLALMCDFIVVAEGTELIYPEAKVGISKGAISAAIRRGPMRVVLEMMLTGAPLDARRAYETGMANRLVATGLHLASARELASQLAANAPLVVEMLKRMSLEALGDTPVQAQFRVMGKVERVVGSEDARNALEAFRARRKPVFRRR